MTRKQTIAALKHQMQHVEVEPVTPWITEPASPPSHQPPRQIPTGGYPIDYGWDTEAEHYQSLSGEGPQ